MKCFIGVLWAGLCMGICAGQAEAPPGAGTAAAPNETKNIVQGRVVLRIALAAVVILRVYKIAVIGW